MMWGWGWSGWWMWAGGALLLLVVAAGIVVAIVLLARSGSSGDQAASNWAMPDDSPHRVLEMRLARGEITPDEFRGLVMVLEAEAARRRAAS